MIDPTAPYFPAIKVLAWYDNAMTDGCEQTNVRVVWSDHLDFLDGDKSSAPAEALQEVIAILWQMVRGYDSSSSPARTEKIVQALIDHSLTVVRHGVADDTKAITALWHNLMEMER